MNWKKMARSLLAVLLLAGGAFAETSSTNTDAVAGSEPFEIKDYSFKTGIVKIKCGSVSTNRPFNSFSEVEQQEITGWLMDKQFMNMRVTLNKETEKETLVFGKSKSKNSNYSGEIQRIWYEIALENASPGELEDIRVEYRIFYETRDSATDGTTAEKKRVKMGKEQFRLLSNETRQVKTETVSLRNRSGIVETKSSTGAKRKANVSDKDRLFGIHVSIIRPDRNGNDVTLEKTDGRIPPTSEWKEFLP